MVELCHEYSVEQISLQPSDATDGAASTSQLELGLICSMCDLSAFASKCPRADLLCLRALQVRVRPVLSRTIAGLNATRHSIGGAYEHRPDAVSHYDSFVPCISAERYVSFCRSSFPIWPQMPC